MGHQEIKTAKEAKESICAKIVKVTEYVSHFNGNIPQNAYYKMAKNGKSTISLSISHPDRYGNEFHKDEIPISGSEIAEIFSMDKELANRFFYHYVTLLRDNENRASLRIGQEIEKAITEIKAL